jgi:multiple sugar transport system substrate-binding protein
MRIKKWCVLLSAALAAAMLSSCGKSETGTDEAKEQVTLIVKVPTLVMNSVSDPEITDAEVFLTKAGQEFAASYEDADVTFDVKVFDYLDEAEAITGSFGTEYATDLLFEGYFNMAAYVHTGYVVPLDDIITDEIRDDIADPMWNMSMTEGKTYMMPYLSMQNILIYNKSLMLECGLDKYVSDSGEIGNFTTDEWTEILDTLAEKLPDNVYPMMMYGKNNQGDTHIMSFIRSYGSTIFDDNGSFDFESEEAVKGLSFIQSGVERGWYPPHCENLEISDLQELFNSNQLVFYVFNNANVILYDNLDDYGFVNFPGNIATSFATGFEVFDNGDDVKVKAAKDFISYIYTNEKWLDISAGNIPASTSVAERYADKITMLSEFMENSVNVVDFMNNSPNWQGNDTSVRSVFYPNIHELLMETVTPEECAANLDRDCNNAIETGWEQSKLHE